MTDDSADPSSSKQAPAMLGEAQFREYVAAFNRDDFEGFGRFYATDIEFDGRGGLFHGRAALLDFYRQVKERVRETLTVRDVIFGAGQLLADVVTQLDPLEDWLDFPTGPLRRGQVKRSRNFLWYDVHAGQFSRIRAAHYRLLTAPSDSPVTPARLPEATGDAADMSPERFNAYIEAFNRDDYAGFGAFYAPDVELVIAGRHELKGREAIIDYYRAVKADTRRTIQVNRLVIDGNRVGAELQSQFVALRDLPDFAAGPMRQGSRMFIHTFVIYETRGGRFTQIRSARYRKRIDP